MNQAQQLQLIRDLTYACDTGDPDEIKVVTDRHFYSLHFEACIDLLSPKRKAERLHRGHLFFADEARRSELVQNAESLLTAALPAPPSSPHD
jgi:hypothetical protein